MRFSAAVFLSLNVVCYKAWSKCYWIQKCRNACLCIWEGCGKIPAMKLRFGGIAKPGSFVKNVVDFWLDVGNIRVVNVSSEGTTLFFLRTKVSTRRYWWCVRKGSFCICGGSADGAPLCLCSFFSLLEIFIYCFFSLNIN